MGQERCALLPVEVFEPDGAGVLRFAYLLHEQEQGDDRWAFYTFSVGASGHVQMSIYFDKYSDLEKAKQLWLSVKEMPESAAK